MNQKTNKSNSLSHILLILAATACTLNFAGCGPGLGEKIVVDGTEVYYDGEQVTKADAEKLGQYLKSQGFSDGTEKAVQLEKEGENWVFKMVLLPDFQKDENTKKEFKLMCLEFSSVFDGQPFVCHGCNDQMESLFSVTGLSGKLVEVGSTSLYHNGLDEKQLTSVVGILNDLGFNEAETTVHMSRSDAGSDFRLTCQPSLLQDEDNELFVEAKIWKEQLGQAVDSKVAIHFCDLNFETHKTVN